ncbi:hypothetical protein [Xanthocytophaga agilis]|uniref:Uncharacterized protein n=1 Tax=Xanthocytophaga agilis TaxID=3048010 RepID=A0AAE3UJE5_9BACT|nr:hypothetical protein [Xanthocytophaga agilis]MDJ1505817.1 hypothetical protein [Xanthocytophaga agilis]
MEVDANHLESVKAKNSCTIECLGLIQHPFQLTSSTPQLPLKSTLTQLKRILPIKFMPNKGSGFVQNRIFTKGSQSG